MSIHFVTFTEYLDMINGKRLPFYEMLVFENIPVLPLSQIDKFNILCHRIVFKNCDDAFKSQFTILYCRSYIHKGIHKGPLLDIYTDSYDDNFAILKYYTTLHLLVEPKLDKNRFSYKVHVDFNHVYKNKMHINLFSMRFPTCVLFK